MIECELASTLEIGIFLHQFKISHLLEYLTKIYHIEIQTGKSVDFFPGVRGHPNFVSLISDHAVFYLFWPHGGVSGRVMILMSTVHVPLFALWRCLFAIGVFFVHICL